jgi:hypothetical protein
MPRPLAHDCDVHGRGSRISFSHAHIQKSTSTVFLTATTAVSIAILRRTIEPHARWELWSFVKYEAPDEWTRSAYLANWPWTYKHTHAHTRTHTHAVVYIPSHQEAGLYLDASTTFCIARHIACRCCTSASLIKACVRHQRRLGPESRPNIQTIFLQRGACFDFKK